MIVAVKSVHHCCNLYKFDKGFDVLLFFSQTCLMLSFFYFSVYVT